MKEAILKLLMEADNYISGERICQTFGVSRTAVWKAVNRLKEEGYTIESVRNKGYRLVQEPVVLAQDAVKTYLSPETSFKSVTVYESVDSTNQAAKAHWQKGHHEPALFLAREQTSGKGRLGRQWQSPKDDSISLSMLLTPDISPQQGSMMTLIAGLATAEAIEEVTGLLALVKWPNDVVIGSRKVSGTLTEMSAEMDGIHYIIVGTGINVNQMEFHEEIVDMATSLKRETGQVHNCNAIAGEVINRFEAYYHDFVEKGSLDFMIEAYNDRCINIGKDLKVIARNGAWEGKGVQVNPDGTLQIKKNDGTITDVNAGEVSVRGLYGYS